MSHEVVREAVQHLILTNELAGSRAGLGLLITWLYGVADDFARHGADVTDLHRTIRHLQRELRRRRDGSPRKEL